MAMMNIETLLEAARFLDEVDKQSSSQSEFSSTSGSSSTASSPSTASPTILQHHHHSHQARGNAVIGRIPGPASTSSPTTASWSVKMSASSPTAAPQTPLSSTNGRTRDRLSQSNSPSGGGGVGTVVVSTNQSQYPTAKAVSLSVANLPQQTAAIPLIIGQQQLTGLGNSSTNSVSINASTKYGTTTVVGHHQQQQQQPPLSSSTLLGSINQATTVATVLGPGGGAGGIHMPGGGVLGVTGQTNNHNGPTIAGGITRIVDSAGNILHLPSGTAAAAVNSGGGGGVAASQYSTLMRVKGNGTAMDNMTEEQPFGSNESLPPSLVVISPQNYAANPTTTVGGHLGGIHSQQQQQLHHHHQSHPQTISIIPTGPLSGRQAGGGGSNSESVTGLDLSHVDLVHSTSGSHSTNSSSSSALLSNQKPTNTFELTTTNLTKKNHLMAATAAATIGQHHHASSAAVVAPSPTSSSSSSASVFVHRKSAYPVVDLPASSASSSSSLSSLSSSSTGTTMVIGTSAGVGVIPTLPTAKVRTISGSSSSGSAAASIMKSTNFVSGGGKPPAAAVLANGGNLLSSAHFQHAASSSSTSLASDKPEDLSSHLTFNLGSTTAPNGGYPGSVMAPTVEAVNTILSKTTGGVTTATLHVGQPRPIINLSELSLDPQQLQDLQQQQSLYQMVYQKGVTTPGSATSAGRRRTTSNNSTGGSQRSPSSMRSGTRESHNKLEKNRRAQMRMCFDQLKKQLPKGQEEKKTSNLSILSNALKYIMTLKRTDKEWEHELERLVKEKIGLEIKLASLKREMAVQLDKDPALASLVAVGPTQRSIRTSESGLDEANSMDGYPSNGDETDSFRGSSIVERSMSPRNLSPLVISGPLNGTIKPPPLINTTTTTGGEVSMELKALGAAVGEPSVYHHHLAVSGVGSGGIVGGSGATILAVPNFNQVSLSSSQLPLTAINLSTTGTPSSMVSTSAAASVTSVTTKNGVISLPSATATQIISGSPFLHAAATTGGANGPHVIVHQPPMMMKSGSVVNNNGFSGVGKGNGLIIREAVGATTIEGTSGGGKVMKFGNNAAGGCSSSDLIEPPTKMLKLLNGQATTTNAELMSSQATIQHTQVLPIYTSTQNGGLRVIGHHTTTTTSMANGSISGGNLPTNVVFNDASAAAAKYHQHLPSGMVISGAAHPYLANGLNGGNNGGTGGLSNSSAGAPGAQVHKLLLTGMGPNMIAQNVSTTGAFSLPSTMTAAQDTGSMYPTLGSTSLPGGAQLNVLSRSPSSTPSPTISITSTSNGGKGIAGQKGGRVTTQISALPLVNGGVGTQGMPVVGQPNGSLKAPVGASAKMISPQLAAVVPPPPPMSKAATTKGTKGGNGKRQAANGGANVSRAAKRKNAAATNPPTTSAAVMITPQTSMEPVKKNIVAPAVLGKGLIEVSPSALLSTTVAATTSHSFVNATISAVSSMASITPTNSKPTIK